MNVKILYTELGAECCDVISLPANAVHKPDIGAVLNKFHGKKQINKRYSTEIDNSGRKIRRYWYQRGLYPCDYHVYKVISTGNKGTLGAGTFTYELDSRTPNMWVPTEDEINEDQQELKL